MPSRPKLFHPRPQPSRAELKRQYDSARGSARERGYSAAWDRQSEAFKRSHPLCLGCQAMGKVTATEVTDHVVPHRGDMVAFWDAGLWQPACRWHHDVVKQQLEARFDRGELAAGELWLNSSAAVRLALELIEGGGSIS